MWRYLIPIVLFAVLAVFFARGLNLNLRTPAERCGISAALSSNPPFHRAERMNNMCPRMKYIVADRLAIITLPFCRAIND